MITAAQYFAGKPHTPAHEEAADDLLTRVNALIDEAVLLGRFTRRNCPNTGTEISGSHVPVGEHASGDGGFRLQNATTGKGLSSHKEAKGVDDYDAKNELDTWLDEFEDGAGGNSKLEEYGLYREAPDSTEHWCHLTTRAPHSGHRTFQP